MIKRSNPTSATGKTANKRPKKRHRKNASERALTQRLRALHSASDRLGALVLTLGDAVVGALVLRRQALEGIAEAEALLAAAGGRK